MRSTRHALLAALCVLLAASGARADKIDDYLRAEMAKQSIPGLSLAVLRGGKLVKARGYGFANLELRVPATPETVYKIASVSKQFVAAGILLLAQDGRLHLDDPLSRYCDDPPEAWHAITLRHLLTMTSGLPRELPGWSPYREYTEAEILEAARKAEPRAAPGEKWEYGNLGYFLLAGVIRRASGKPWGEFLRQRIFEPLGMSDTRLASHAAVVPNRADGYLRVGDEWRNAGPLLSARPSGGLLSTVLDLAKWDAALATGKLIPRETMRQAWRPVMLNDGRTHPYGFGWALGEVRGRRLIEHGGSLAGFRTQFSRFVEDRITVIILTNCNASQPAELARGVAARYIPALREEPDDTASPNPGAALSPRAPVAGVRPDRAGPDRVTLPRRGTTRHDRGGDDPRRPYRAGHGAADRGRGDRG